MFYILMYSGIMLPYYGNAIDISDICGKHSFFFIIV